MKIEVGESLMRSWLRHVKGCQFAELNWKPSGSWIQYHQTQRFMDVVRPYFEQSLGVDIFEGTKTASQLVKQGEIDVLGIKLDGKGATERLYAIDVAFHEGGLNYGGTNKTTARIVKKLIRSVMIAYTYFGPIPCEFVFASPKVGKPYREALESGIKQIENLLTDQGIICEITLLINEVFRKEVLINTVQNSSGTADSSELFLRSHRLWGLFESGQAPTEITTESKTRRIFSNEPNSLALPILFEPADTEEFKDRLLNCKKARIIIEYADGTYKERSWIAEKFSKDSNLLGNLRSRPEFRQGEWQKRGIARLKVVIDDIVSSIGSNLSGDEPYLSVQGEAKI